MSYSYDTEPTTTYTRDTSTSLYSWDDPETTWDDPIMLWGGIQNYDYDQEPGLINPTWADMSATWAEEVEEWGELQGPNTLNYTNDSKP